MISTSLEDQVRRLVATIFDVPVGSVTGATARGELERWDSMGHLVLVLELEQTFGIELPPEQVQRLTSVGAIADILSGDYGICE